jgi:colanic acid biosynthesis glycosyl transferase WcaI
MPSSPPNSPLSKQRIIFLNRYAYPDHSATSQMLSDLSFALAKRGYDIHVIASRQRYDAADARLAPLETVAGVTLHRVWTSRFGRKALAGRAVDYATFYGSAAACLLRLARPGDVVVTKTDPPVLSVVIGPVARLRRTHLINWLQDLFPEVALAIGARNNRLARYVLAPLALLRDRSLRRASMNVVIGEKMRQRVEQRGVDSRRIRMIPNWADGRLVVPVPPEANALRRQWDLADAFVVGYSGNLGRAHEIETLVEAIERIERHARPARAAPTVVAATALQTASLTPPLDDQASPAQPWGGRPIRWLFIGGGAQSDRLRIEVERRGLSSVQFRPYQPRNELAQALGAADVHLVSLRPELEGLIVPSKIYGIAAAGRPTIFIGDVDGEVAHLLRRSRSGFTVAEGDGEGLARTILDLAADPAETAARGANASNLFRSELDLPVAIAAWEQVLAACGVSRSSAASDVI